MGGWVAASLGSWEESPGLWRGTRGCSCLSGLALGLPDSVHCSGSGHLLAPSHACGSVGGRLTPARTDYGSWVRAQRPGAKPAVALAAPGAARWSLTPPPAL